VLNRPGVSDGRPIRDGYSNATINREMAALKRAFRLAHRAGRAASVPHIDMLDEDNARKGFFEPDQLETLLTHLSRRARAGARGNWR
jgi:hypothetical protein